ncbi:3-methylitaconate isomerase [Advenella kashmirensis W13003]|uniref:3-methylitaconate isomerase n=1 Tax=Advenella kashmirensis W13003 TaxID=1424334 RepID=V8QUG2_9BURK|nr:PrpF domain-containing protein [Advenella kashmirensis]ETF02993.1 3-methylitaconate isomerase [Advenella kashmirensis W13003]
MNKPATLTQPEQRAVPCVILRGGTSKGIYFHEEHVPAPGPERDHFLQTVMGSPDILQINGLGGSRLITSKIAIVKRSERDDADIDYTYAQVVPDRDVVSYAGNCGNISSGVGSFAIDEGLVSAVEPITQVRIFNTNTQKILVAHVPVGGGLARVHGDFAIPGVPGTGAEIFMDYSKTAGAKTGKLLPTGSAQDVVQLEDGTQLTVTLGDLANPCVFVHAQDVGLTGSEMPVQINENKALISRLKEIRGRAAVLAGFCDDWKRAEAASPSLPLVVIIAGSDDYLDMNGKAVPQEHMDLRARLVFYNKCHESMAGTGSMCTAAMSRIPNTIVNLTARNTEGDTLRIGHPLGVMHVVADANSDAVQGEVRFKRLGFSRTARRIMSGTVYIPNKLTSDEIG